MIKQLGAERGLLAGLVKDPESLYTIDDIISPSDFFNAGNEAIYTVIRHLIIEDSVKNIDKMMIIAGAASLGLDKFSDVTSKHNLVDAIMVTDVNKENIRNFALKVKGAAVRRGLSVKLNESREIVESDSSKELMDVIGDAESTIFDYVQSVNLDGGMQNLGDGFFDWANSKADNPRECTGLTTQFSRWDKAIGGGIRNGTVHVIGARAKAGKSAFALNVAAQVALNDNIPVLYLDSELSFEYQRSRLGSLLSGVESNKIENGTWRNSTKEVEAVKTAWAKIQDSPNLYHISVAGWGIERIISTIRRFIAKHVRYDEAGRVNPCLVIFDYLKLLDESVINRNMAEHQILGQYMTKLHDTANIYQIPMLVLCQLNRDGIEKENESVIAGADKIVWFCSSFSILKKKTIEELSNDGAHLGNMKLKCILSRYGHGHNDDEYLNLKRNDKCWRFTQGKESGVVEKNIKELLEKQKIKKEKINSDMKSIGEVAKND